MRRNPCAFTLVEMMVVLTVSLLLMTMVVPIFKVSTKTVQIIERRLAVYEAARNIIDIIESEVQLGVVNERGGHWSLKHVSWNDTDPFTPDSTPANIGMPAGVTDTNNLAFRQSRRVSDAFDYISLESSGMPYGPKQFPGGKAFPLAYPIDFTYDYPECFKSSLRSTLLYQTPFQFYNSDYQTDASMQRWNRNEQLADVSQIEAAFIYYSVLDQCCFNGGSNGLQTHCDQLPDTHGPGKEIKVAVGFFGAQGIQLQRRLGNIKVMDLSISYWDDSAATSGGKQFKDLPDNTVVYFWPPPKAIRVTVTVCDFQKRDTITLCRVIQIPMGSGTSLVNTAAMDSAYYTPAPGNTTPAIFNRTKYLPTLPPANNGDDSWPYAFDSVWNSTETRIITSDTPAKPINWP